MTGALAAVVSFVVALFTPKADGGSPPLKLSWEDLWKVFRGTLIVAASAGVTYLLEHLNVIASGSPLLLMAVPLISAALEALRRLLTDTQPQK